MRQSDGRQPVLEIHTERGSIELRLFPREAPPTVFKILSRARHGYFDGQRFHRVVPNVVVRPHTGGSQFFVTHSPQPHLDGGYTLFGELLRGGDVLDRIVQGDRTIRVTVH